jgi:hypothetical protein
MDFRLKNKWIFWGSKMKQSFLKRKLIFKENKFLEIFVMSKLLLVIYSENKSHCLSCTKWR